MTLCSFKNNIKINKNILKKMQRTKKEKRIEVNKINDGS